MAEQTFAEKLAFEEKFIRAKRLFSKLEPKNTIVALRDSERDSPLVLLCNIESLHAPVQDPEAFEHADAMKVVAWDSIVDEMDMFTWGELLQMEEDFEFQIIRGNLLGVQSILNEE